MKNIAIILTLYKPNTKDLEFWSKASKTAENMGYEFFVINDNPELDFSSYFNFYQQNEVNIKKFKTVFKFVQSNKLKSKYLKVCDPDDRIVFRDLEEINDLVSSFKVDYGFIHMQERIIERGAHKEISSKSDKFFSNWLTLLSVDSLKKNKYFKDEWDDILFLEDQLLGLLSFSMNKNYKIIDKNFYIYYKNMGMTHHSDPNDLVDDLISVFKIYHSIIKLLPEENSIAESNFHRLYNELKAFLKSDNSLNEISKSRLNSLLTLLTGQNTIL